MTVPKIERRIRAGLPIVRLMQKFIPLSAANSFLKLSTRCVKLGSDVARNKVNADGVPCYWVIPKNYQPDRVLLYLHGGGFVFRLTPQHVKMAGYLTKKLGFRILLVDYHTAPEHSFPAPLDDAENVYMWLIDQGILSQNIMVAGDSAGGTLTLTLMLKLKESGNDLPAAAACLSPAVDFSPKARQSSDFKDPLLPSKAMKFYTQSYLGNSDPHNPLLSPIFGNLEGLPPLLIHVGEDEILREDAIRINDKARSAGVDVHLEIYPRMWHVWQLFLSLPQAKQSLDDIAQFFKDHSGLIPK